MSLFNRKPKATPETPEDDPEEFLKHLVGVTTKGFLAGTPEASSEAAAHIAKDIAGNPPVLVAQALGLAVIMEGDARARDLRGRASRLFEALFESDPTERPQEPAEDAETLQADDAPQEPSEAPSAAQEADEKVWTEDRR